MIKNAATVVTALLLSGCVTAVLAPGADKIALTKNPADVEKCRPAGSLQVLTAFPDDGVTALRNQALGMGSGADTILITGGALTSSNTMALSVNGVAYRCHEAAAAATP